MKNPKQLTIIVLLTVTAFVIGGILTTVVLASSSLAQRLAGRILLQVESKGEAWYVDPLELTRHYLGRPADCFDLMRKKGLGISNNDLGQIPIGNFDPERDNLTHNSQGDELIETKFKLAILNFWQVRSVFRDPQNKNKFYYVTNFDDGSDIWVYDLAKDKTYQLNGTFNIPEGNTLLLSQKLAKYQEFRGVGIVSDKFVFVETSSDNSPGPCFSPWFYSDLEYINLGVSKPTRKPFTLPNDLKSSEEQKVSECQKSL